jgi:hypothetical protein
MRWVLNRGDEHWEAFRPVARRRLRRAPDADGARRRGHPVINDHFALPHLQRGELQAPDWRLPRSAWAVFPGRRLMPARTRVFVDALAAKHRTAMSGDRGGGCETKRVCEVRRAIIKRPALEGNVKRRDCRTALCRSRIVATVR